MEKIINVNNNKYIIKSDTDLTQEQLNNITSKLSCNNPTNILTKTCSRTSGKVGETVTLKATDTVGTPNYTITFKKDTTIIETHTNVPSETEKITTYTLVTGDIGIRKFSVIISDSCSTGSLTCEEYCDVTVTSACISPSCSFSVS